MTWKRKGTATPSRAMDGLRSDYTAMNASRFRAKRTGLPAMGAGADYHYVNEANYLRLIEYSRDMDRNDALVGTALDRAVDNTVQSGFTLDPETGDKELDKAITARWKEWAGNPELCDISKRFNFPQMERMALRSMFVDGDIFTVGTNTTSGALQTWEAHRVRTPQNTTLPVIHGVEISSTREPLRAWVTKDDLEPQMSLNRVGDVNKLDFRDADGMLQIFHLCAPKRMSQTRGIGALAPIFDITGMAGDVVFAKLVQQQIVSCIGFIEQHTDNTSTDPLVFGATSTGTSSDGSTSIIDNIAPGMSIRVPKGKELKPWSPDVPNSSFFEHYKQIVTLIGINLGLPFVMLMMDGSETNFSGWRGAIDQAKFGFIRNQGIMKTRFHEPIFRFILSKWIATDPYFAAKYSKLGAGIFAHKWSAPRWPYVQPLQDAQAQTWRLRNGLTSPRRLHAEIGQNYDDIVSETVSDNKEAIRQALMAAQELNTDFPEANIQWRELFSLPTPDGVTVSLTSGTPPESSAPPQDQPEESPTKNGKPVNG